MTHLRNTSDKIWFLRNDTVHIKGDLFGKRIDEVFHRRCWDKCYPIGNSS